MLYFGGSFIQLIAGIFTQPIFSRYLEATDFAIIGYFTSITLFFLPLSNLSLTSYYLMRYFRQTEDQNKVTLSNILNFLTMTNLIVIVVAYGILFWYFTALRVEFDLFPFAMITLLSMVFDIHKTFFLIDCRIKKKGWTYFFVSVVAIFFNIGFSLYYVVTLHGGAAGKLAGPLTSHIIVAVLVVYMLSKINNYRLSYKFSFHEIKTALLYSFPLILSAYAYFPIQNIDKIYLERLNNPDEFGFYNIGFMLSTYLSTLTVALFQGFEPDIYKFIVKNNSKKFIAFSFIYIALIALLIAFFILFSRPIADYLTAGRYTRAFVYANYNVIAVLLMRIAGLFNVVLKAREKTKSLLYVNLTVGIVSLIVYKLFILRWGFFGANYARIFIGFFDIVINIIVVSLVLKNFLPRKDST